MTRSRRASAGPGRCGRSSTTTRSRTSWSRASRWAGGLPLAAVTGPASVMDAVDPGGLGGTFGGNPVSCAAANVVLDQVASMRAASEALGARMRAALHDMASRVESIGEVRGLGPMLALEIVRDRETKTPAPEVVAGAIASARAQGLLLLACGLYGNVLRLLPPLTISDD